MPATMIVSRPFLLWAPRALAISFSVFMGTFSMYVFGAHLGLWRTVVHVADLLIPSFIILSVVALAWRWEWLGAIAFAAIGVYCMKVWLDGIPYAGSPYAVDCFLVAALYLISWLAGLKHRRMD